MNTQPAQPIPGNGQGPDTNYTAIPIDAVQLAHIAELLNILDGFLRQADGVADQLVNYLLATGRDHPQPPDWTGYNANLLLDQVSFTAHSLRSQPRERLQ